MKEFWDQRYAQAGYAYGTEPNAFFKANLDRIPGRSPGPGRILLPGEGEGRNAVYAARQGWSVSAFDPSARGRDKALQLATTHGVTIDYQIAGFDDANFEAQSFDALALVFVHIHEDARRATHRRLATAIAPGGRLIIEAYSKAQLRYGSGGPPVESMLYGLEDLREDFAELELLTLEQVEVEVIEGEYHTGLASVIRLVAIR